MRLHPLSLRPHATAKLASTATHMIPMFLVISPPAARSIHTGAEVRGQQYRVLYGVLRGSVRSEQAVASLRAYLRHRPVSGRSTRLIGADRRTGHFRLSALTGIV